MILTQASEALKCQLMSDGSFKANVLLYILKQLIAGYVVESSCELWLCFGLESWHRACFSIEYVKHSAI